MEASTCHNMTLDTYIEIGQSILMAKNMAGFYEMGLCWFQIAWEYGCVLDEVLTFNQID